VYTIKEIKGAVEKLRLRTNLYAVPARFAVVSVNLTSTPVNEMLRP
jgi:hypothetical protein